MNSSEDDHILYIHPSANTSPYPVIDQYTRKMVGAFSKARPMTSNRGFRRCACGVSGSNSDFQLQNGKWTSSLCIHYLAYHRNKISSEELQKVEWLPFGEAGPTLKELNKPTRI